MMQFTWVHKITLAPPPLIEMPVSSSESDRSCIYVGIEVMNLSLLLLFFDWIWDCSYCGIFRLDLGLFALWYFSIRFGTVRTVVFFDQI